MPNPEISQIKVGNTIYNIKDVVSRNSWNSTELYNNNTGFAFTSSDATITLSESVDNWPCVLIRYGSAARPVWYPVEDEGQVTSTNSVLAYRIGNSWIENLKDSKNRIIELISVLQAGNWGYFAYMGVRFDTTTTLVSSMTERQFWMQESTSPTSDHATLNKVAADKRVIRIFGIIGLQFSH